MVMRMEEGLDTGPRSRGGEHGRSRPRMTAGELHDKMMRLGADLMGRALGALERGSLGFHAARRRGRHLRRQDREGRSADRLDRAGAGGADDNSWAFAVSRRLVRSGHRRLARPSKCCAARGRGEPVRRATDRR